MLKFLSKEQLKFEKKRQDMKVANYNYRPSELSKQVLVSGSDYKSDGKADNPIQLNENDQLMAIRNN